MQENDAAFEVAKELIRLQFPDAFSAYRLALYSGLMAGKRDDVLALCDQYLTDFPPHGLFIDIKKELKSGVEIGQVLMKFELP